MIRKGRVARGARKMAERMLAKRPQAKSKIVDAPYLSASNQPSYYPPGTLPVASTAGKHRQSEGREWEWKTKSVPIAEISTHCPNLVPSDVPRAIARGEMIQLIRRGDWADWQIDTGQYFLQTGRRRHWEWIAGRWQVTIDGPAHTQVHFTNPLVLTHLEGRDIVCESTAQVDAECERVGAQVLR